MYFCHISFLNVKHTFPCHNSHPPNLPDPPIALVAVLIVYKLITACRWPSVLDTLAGAVSGLFSSDVNTACCNNSLPCTLPHLSCHQHLWSDMPVSWFLYHISLQIVLLSSREANEEAVCCRFCFTRRVEWHAFPVMRQAMKLSFFFFFSPGVS